MYYMFVCLFLFLSLALPGPPGPPGPPGAMGMKGFGGEFSIKIVQLHHSTTATLPHSPSIQIPQNKAIVAL